MLSWWWFFASSSCTSNPDRSTRNTVPRHEPVAGVVFRIGSFILVCKTDME